MPRKKKSEKIEKKQEERKEENKTEVKGTKKQIILFRKNHPIEEDREDFEGDFEDSSDNVTRTRAPAPFLIARPVVNLERELEDVPTTDRREEPTTVNYATAAKSSYAGTTNASYTGAPGNAPVYSENRINPNPASEIIDGSFIPREQQIIRDQAIDFKKWQQSNLGMNPSSSQQENYKTNPEERFEPGTGLPFNQKRKNI